MAGNYEDTWCHWISEVTHTCQHWRAIALSSGALWSNPDFYHPARGAEMIKRSGKSALDIFYNLVDDHRDKHVLEAKELIGTTLATQSHRVGKIDLVGPPSFLSELLARVQAPVPLLKYLFLDCATQDGDIGRPYISGDIFMGAMAKMSELSLHFCDLGFTPFCPNLRILHVEDARIQSLADLHLALQSMTQLHELAIHNALITPPPEDYHPAFMIHLPRLSSLFITDTASSISALLAPLRCSFPTLTPERLVVDHTDTENVPVDHVAKIAHWISSSLTLPITGISLHADTSQIRCFVARDTSHIDTDEWAPLVLRVPRDISIWRQVFGTYIHHLQLNNLTYLLISDIFLTDDQWLPLFTQAKHTTVLHISGSENTGLNILLPSMRMWRTILQEEYPHQDEGPLLPHLRRVILQGPSPRPANAKSWVRVLESRLPATDAQASAILEFQYPGDPPAELREILVQYPRVRAEWNGEHICVDNYGGGDLMPGVSE